jgi:transposase
MRSIGLDVHKRFAQVAILEGKDPPISRRIGTTSSELRAFAATLRPDDQLVLEATMNTWAIADLLRESGARVVISNPLRTRAIAEAKVKTDKVDALTLAQLLAADFVPEVWTPDAETRRLRREVAGRAALVRQRTQVRNRIHAVLHRCLIDAPVTDLFGVAGRAWLTEVLLPEDERALVEATLRVHEAIEAEIALLERRLADIALADVRVERLMTIPGIGAVSALALVAVVGDIARFRRPGKLVSYLGLDPRVHQSGEREAHPGHISRAGQAHARSLLVEAARGAVSTPGPLRAFYRRIERRRGAAIAVVAVARKLVVLAWHILTSGERFRFERATVVREKRRALERRLGIPALRRRPAPGEPNLAARRERELVTLLEAEAAYKAEVASRTTKDAAAAKGEATVRPSKGQDARRSLRPQRSALFTGSTASEEGGYDSGLDSFIRRSLLEGPHRSGPSRGDRKSAIFWRQYP